MTRTAVDAYPWGSDTVFAAELDGDGLIQRANPALEQAGGGKLAGVPFAHLIAPEQQPAFERRLDELPGGILVSATFAFSDRHGAGAEDRLVWLTRRSDGGVELIAEPAWGEHDRLIEQVLQLNDDLISTQRVAARRQRDLELAQEQAAHSAARIRRLEAILLAGLTPGDFDIALHRLLRIAQDLLPGDRADILLLDDSRDGLVLRASAGPGAADAERYGRALEIGGSGVLDGILHGEGGGLIDHLPVASGDGATARQGSLIGVPLRSEEQRIGVLLASAAEPGAFARDDLRLLELVGERIALAIGQAQLRERERRLAETLQRSLLPQALPELGGLRLAARYLPHITAVGGDFYDALVLENGTLGLAIGDVTGKGLRAAAAMGRLRSALHAYAIDSDEPADVLGRLGRLAQFDEAMATALYLTIRPDTGEIRLSSAGHLPPLRVSCRGASPGDAAYIDIRRALSPPLGLSVGRRRQMGLRLERGHTLLLYTDGLVERTRNIDAGMDALAAAAAGLGDCDPDVLCDRLLAQLGGDARYHDDVALIALRRM
jgi:sigma-B regulation protein RsbU (phosphoserine phosphatase)